MSALDVPESHAAALKELRDLPEAAIPALSAYLALLSQWNQRINLTGARLIEERVRTLVQPALDIRPHLRGCSLLDVGSGNGSPGLILAVLMPDIVVTLLEPRQKRWAFLREAARRAGASRLRVERCRHDEYVGPRADTVTVRALSLPLGELATLAQPRGRIIVMGARPEPHVQVAPARQELPPDLHVYDIVPRETAR